MLVADTLGVPMERVTIEPGDTERLAKGVGTWGSRSLQLGGMAIRTCSEEILEQARRTAAGLLEAAEDDLVQDASRGVWHVVGAPHAAVSWADIANAVDPVDGLSAAVDYRKGLATYPSGTHLSVVEVDMDTGKVTLKRHICVDDAGRVLNPLIAEGQRHGGIAQGVAQALLEEVRYDEDGNPTTSTFVDYAFISAPELPSFELLDMQTPTPSNALGVKGLGEAGTIGAGPAVQNAVVDALAHLGVRHIDMPLTSQRVWTHIHESPEEGR
jgi:CO/xanthine dehydrogenase Mo-binding subunit